MNVTVFLAFELSKPSNMSTRVPSQVDFKMAYLKVRLIYAKYAPGP